MGLDNYDLRNKPGYWNVPGLSPGTSVYQDINTNTSCAIKSSNWRVRCGDGIAPNTIKSAYPASAPAPSATSSNIVKFYNLYELIKTEYNEEFPPIDYVSIRFYLLAFTVIGCFELYF